MSETVKVTTPDPLPDCPPVIVIQVEPGVAVQVQPCSVVIVAVRMYATDMHGLNAIGVTEYWQTTGAGGSPAWLTVNVRSPTAIVPLRGFTSLFLSTENNAAKSPRTSRAALDQQHLDDACRDLVVDTQSGLQRVHESRLGC